MSIIKRTLAVFLSSIMLGQNIISAGPPESDSSSSSSSGRIIISSSNDSPVPTPGRGPPRPRTSHKGAAQGAKVGFMSMFKRRARPGSAVPSTTPSAFADQSTGAEFPGGVTRPASAEASTSRAASVQRDTPTGAVIPTPSAPRAPSGLDDAGPAYPEGQAAGPASLRPSKTAGAIDTSRKSRTLFLKPGRLHLRHLTAFSSTGPRDFGKSSKTSAPDSVRVSPHARPQEGPSAESCDVPGLPSVGALRGHAGISEAGSCSSSGAQPGARSDSRIPLVRVATSSEDASGESSSDESSEVSSLELSSAESSSEGNVLPAERVEPLEAVDIRKLPIGLDFAKEGPLLSGYLANYIVYHGEIKSRVSTDERILHNLQEMRANLVGYRRYVVDEVPEELGHEFSPREYLRMHYSKTITHRNWLKFIYYDHENPEVKATARRAEITLRFKAPISLPKLTVEEETALIEALPLVKANIEGLREAYLSAYTGVYWRDSSVKKPPWCCYFWEKLAYPTTQLGRFVSFAYMIAIFNYFIRGSRVVEGGLPFANPSFLAFSGGMLLLVLLASFTVEARVSLELRKWLSSVYHLNASKNVIRFGKVIHNLFWLPVQYYRAYQR